MLKIEYILTWHYKYILRYFIYQFFATLDYYLCKQMSLIMFSTIWGKLKQLNSISNFRIVMNYYCANPNTYWRIERYFLHEYLWMYTCVISAHIQIGRLFAFALSFALNFKIINCRYKTVHKRPRTSTLFKASLYFI